MQRGAFLAILNSQKPVASNKQVFYIHAHNCWIALDGVEISLPHNPSVPGSSPGCPILLDSSYSPSFD